MAERHLPENRVSRKAATPTAADDEDRLKRCGERRHVRRERRRQVLDRLRVGRRAG
jgi:hypothetical protein